MDEKFGFWLKMMLVDRGWEQVDLATAVGVSETTVSRWINKGVRPELHRCLAIAGALHADLREVVARAGYPVPDYEISPEPSGIELLERALGMLRRQLSQQTSVEVTTYEEIRGAGNGSRRKFLPFSDQPPTPLLGSAGTMKPQSEERAVKARYYELRSPDEACAVLHGEGAAMYVRLMFVPAAEMRHEDSKVIVVRIHGDWLSSLAAVDGETLVFELTHDVRPEDRIAACIDGRFVVGRIKRDARSHGLVIRVAGTGETFVIDDERLTLMGLFQGRYLPPEEDRYSWE